MKVKFKKLHPDAKMPLYASDGAACADIYAIDDGVYISYDVIEYKTGLAFEIPKGYEITMRPRSSISKYGLILCNAPATIDEDFTSEVTVRFRIPSFREQFPTYKKGDRIVQISLDKVKKMEFEAVEEIVQTGRGAYGSTGK